MNAIALGRRLRLMRTDGVFSSKRVMCTPRRIAGSVGRVICARAAAIRKHRRGASRAATSFATGWTFASPATASFQARGRGALRLDQNQAHRVQIMATIQPPKLIARNVAAARRFADPSNLVSVTAGNPVSTRLESGIGNCFPGLECDLRNLERRFFPLLETDPIGNFIFLASVDTDGVARAEAV